MNDFYIADRKIGAHSPTYFIADIAANHDGDLQRAIYLIHLAAEAGAEAAKFQHFRAAHIVSKEGFEAMGNQASHQLKWKKSVFEVYQNASVPWDWTPDLKAACDQAGIHFLSTPYDLEAIETLEPYMPAFKIGSGDITWIDAVEKIASKGKPVVLATGASDLADVQRAVAAILKTNNDLVLMQCNTNYTGSLENFQYIDLNVLKTYAAMYPSVVLGLSDHTPGHASVLGAVALGARVIEKHFTDDCRRDGPDHPFALDPTTWRDMVDRTRELESAIGTGNKTVQENEKETVVIQRRCIRFKQDLPEGHIITKNDLEVLRPAPKNSIFPYDLHRVLGLRLLKSGTKGDYLRWTDIG